jgi:hypothetical protein
MFSRERLIHLLRYSVFVGTVLAATAAHAIGVNY